MRKDIAKVGEWFVQFEDKPGSRWRHGYYETREDAEAHAARVRELWTKGLPFTHLPPFEIRVTVERRDGEPANAEIPAMLR